MKIFEPEAGRNAAAPRIWYSRLPQTTDFSVGLDFCLPRNDVQTRLAVNIMYDRHQPIPAGDAPRYLVLERQNGREARIRPGCRDAFKITDGLIVISPKLRDVLVRFDLGGTQLFEVPILKSDGETASGLPSHFILNVVEAKDCFVPEASENVERLVRWGATEPEPGAPWKAKARTCRIAVRASAAEGSDLWFAPDLLGRLFLSDRLRQAIDAAGTTRKGLAPVEALVLPDPAGAPA